MGLFDRKLEVSRTGNWDQNASPIVTSDPLSQAISNVGQNLVSQEMLAQRDAVMEKYKSDREQRQYDREDARDEKIDARYLKEQERLIANDKANEKYRNASLEQQGRRKLSKLDTDEDGNIIKYYTDGSHEYATESVPGSQMSNEELFNAPMDEETGFTNAGQRNIKGLLKSDKKLDPLLEKQIDYNQSVITALIKDENRTKEQDQLLEDLINDTEALIKNAGRKVPTKGGSLTSLISEMKGETPTPSVPTKNDATTTTPKVETIGDKTANLNNPMSPGILGSQRTLIPDAKKAEQEITQLEDILSGKGDYASQKLSSKDRENILDRIKELETFVSEVYKLRGHSNTQYVGD